jgi:hypothetical protein
MLNRLTWIIIGKKNLNGWYDEIHILDVAEGCAEFLVCRRDKVICGPQGHAAYLAVIEIETDDVDRTTETHRKNSERLRAKGRWTDLIQIFSRKLYKLDRKL